QASHRGRILQGGGVPLASGTHTRRSKKRARRHACVIDQKHWFGYFGDLREVALRRSGGGKWRVGFKARERASFLRGRSIRSRWVTRGSAMCRVRSPIIITGERARSARCSTCSKRTRVAT